MTKLTQTGVVNGLARRTATLLGQDATQVNHLSIRGYRAV